MTKFQIPAVFIPGLESLISLNDSDIRTLYDSLKSMPEGTGPKKFHTLLSESIQVANIESLTEALFSLGGLLVEATDLKELSEDFVSSFCSQRKNDTSEKEREMFLSRVFEIFNLSTAIRTTFKAYNVIEDNSNIFQDCRILSDIRLIFENDLSSERKKKGVVVHRLKMHNRNNGKTEHSYFSLDLNDLLKLKQQVERAIEKDSLIKKEYIELIDFIDITE